MTARAEGLAIRRFRESDLDEVCGLVSETIDTSYASVYLPRVIEFFHQYHEPAAIVSDAASGHTIVVRSRGVLIATGTRAGTTIRRVFVCPGWQRRGIGKTIMAELERGALAAGIARLDLSASLPAKEFYLGLGYEVVSDEDYEVAPGQHLEYYEMAKKL